MTLILVKSTGQVLWNVSPTMWACLMVLTIGAMDLVEDSHRGESPSHHLLSGGPDVDVTASLFQPLSLDLHMIQVFLVGILGLHYLNRSSVALDSAAQRCP